MTGVSLTLPRGASNTGPPRSNYHHALAALKPKPRFGGCVCRTDRRNILRRASVRRVTAFGQSIGRQVAHPHAERNGGNHATRSAFALAFAGSVGISAA